jgi:hypothetical protein
MVVVNMQTWERGVVAVIQAGLGLREPRRHDDPPEGRSHMHPRWSLSDVPLRLPVSLRLALLVTAAGLAAAACGPSGHQAAGGGTHQPAVTQCGMARTPANVPVKVEITKGQVGCSAAMSVEHQYRKAILDGKGPGAGGSGPVNVGGWQCRVFPTPQVLKTGWASRCTRSGAEILAVLPAPS